MQNNSSITFRIVEFIFRIIGWVVVSVWGVWFGAWALNLFGTPAASDLLVTQIVFFLVGGLSGFILIPYVTTRPARAIRRRLGHLSAETLFAGLVGLIVGLLAAALLAFPLSLLPTPFGAILPFIGTIAFSYFGVALFVMRQGDIMGLFSSLSGRGGEGVLFMDKPQPHHLTGYERDHRWTSC